jgi:uncharacterized membrane protein YgcG
MNACVCVCVHVCVHVHVHVVFRFRTRNFLGFAKEIFTDAGKYCVHFGYTPDQAAAMAQATIAARSGKADVAVTPLARARTEVAVIPSVTGSQLVRGMLLRLLVCVRVCVPVRAGGVHVSLPQYSGPLPSEPLRPCGPATCAARTHTRAHTHAHTPPHTGGAAPAAAVRAHDRPRCCHLRGLQLLLPALPRQRPHLAAPVHAAAAAGQRRRRRRRGGRGGRSGRSGRGGGGGGRRSRCVACSSRVAVMCRVLVHTHDAPRC